MPRVVHFEIQADEPERAITFYSGVFSWTFQKFAGPFPYWVIVTGSEGPGINGGLLPRRGSAPVDGQPVNAFVCTVEVEHLDASLASVEEHGGRIVVQKMPVPGVGWLAYCKDTEGNILGLMQPDPSAK